MRINTRGGGIYIKAGGQLVSWSPDPLPHDDVFSIQKTMNCKKIFQWGFKPNGKWIQCKSCIDSSKSRGNGSTSRNISLVSSRSSIVLNCSHKHKRERGKKHQTENICLLPSSFSLQVFLQWCFPPTVSQTWSNLWHFWLWVSACGCSINKHYLSSRTSNRAGPPGGTKGEVSKYYGCCV